jgi:endonuclease/exonuclease/phosphatase (EEP) superfamily protein YafD
VPRDAELVLVGRDIRKDDRPTIVAGDLNDVAWSATTTLFLRLSRLLDPRMGRGLYSTFNANCPLFRFPLDHVFHSNCFTLVDLRRLQHNGSDHFPLCMTLQYEPAAAPEQPEPIQAPDQEQDAQEKIIKAEQEEGSLPRQ